MKHKQLLKILNKVSKKLGKSKVGKSTLRKQVKIKGGEK